MAPDGTLLAEEVVPRVHDIPDLPERWIEGLSRDAVREEVFDGSAPNRTRAARERINEELYRNLIALDDGRSPEPMVVQCGDKALNRLINGPGSRYETTRDHVAALMRFHAMGRAGVPAVLSELYRAYVMEVTDTRPQDVAESEFLRLVEGAAALVAATAPSGDRHTTARNLHGDGHDTAGSESPHDAPTWGPVDLSGLLAGEREPLQPTMFQRTDGKCLLYAGMTHSFQGESESGKSLIVQAESVRLINQREDVLYVDFDSDSASVVARLLEFGADPHAVADHFHYRQPEVRPDSAAQRVAWQEMLSTSYKLAVIDGVTDALGIFGYSLKDNDVARWIRTVPKQIAVRTGAAVVLIDHVTKDTSTRNRWAIGGQAKMAGLTGAAYTVQVAAPLGHGMRGEVELRVAKDRPGHVRSHCGSFSNKDRTQQAARIIVDSTASPPEVIIGAPGGTANEESGEETGFRPTNLMQRASALIEQHPGELTKNKVAEKAGGKKQSTLLAVDILYREEYVTSERGRSGHSVYTSLKPYRETNDPQSDRYVCPGNAFQST